LVPAFDGASSAQEWRDALWDRFYTGTLALQQRINARFDFLAGLVTPGAGFCEADVGIAVKREPLLLASVAISTPTWHFTAPGLPEIGWHNPELLRVKHGRFPPFCRPFSGCHGIEKWCPEEDSNLHDLAIAST
jgi:hypothetical protein